MSPIVPVTATLEALLAECVGDAPELVKLRDWRTIALRLSRRMEESGLVIRKRLSDAADRGRIAGPIRQGEVVLAIADGNSQSVIFATGAPMRILPDAIQRAIWHDMLKQAMTDLQHGQDSSA